MKRWLLSALFFASFLLALTFVSAYEISQIPQDILSFMGEFASVMPDAAVAKWLFFFLVFLVVFSLTEVVPFFDKKGAISFLFAVIVSILAVFFLDTNQIYSALVSYKALGITLTSVVPFLFVLYISYKCHEKQQFWVSKLLWILFIVSVIFVASDSATNGNNPFSYIYLIVLLVALAMLVWEGRVQAFFDRMKIKSSIENAKTKGEKEAYLQIAKLLRERADSLDDAEAVKIIDDKITRIKKNMSD